MFGREDCAPQLKKKSFTSDDDMYANCWVCSRQHHLSCVGQATFICAACQRRTQERCVGAGNAGASLSAPPAVAAIVGIPSAGPASPVGIAGSTRASGRRAAAAIMAAF